MHSHFIELLPGIIMACFFGLAIGNFATNPIYRLPRNESLFKRDPYCGDCNALLKPKDLFPVLSWLSTRGKCRYCGAGIPAYYAIAEAAIGALFVICYLQYGFSEQFLLISLGITAFIMLVVMLTLDDFFSDRTLVACIIFGMLHRTLLEHTLYGFAGTAFAAILAGSLVWKLSGKEMARDASAFPTYLKLLVAAGIWLPPLQLLAVLISALLSIPFNKTRKWFCEWTIITCVIILVLTHILQ